MTVGVLLRSLMLVIVMMLLVSACVSDTSASGPITIETTLVTGIDFSKQPFSGTFEVAEGADTLGCSSGTFVDGNYDEPAEGVVNLMTCSEGDTGTFTVFFDPAGYDTGPGVQNGPWRIADATADFTGLQSEGDYWAISELETFTGDIEYTD